MYICVCVYMCMGFPGNTSGKEPVCQRRTHERCRLGPWMGRSPAGGNNNPFQYSCLARKIPLTEEPAGLQSMGLQRVRRDWSDRAHTHVCVLMVVYYMCICIHSRVTWKKFGLENKIDLELHPEYVTSEKSLNFVSTEVDNIHCSGYGWLRKIR